MLWEPSTTCSPIILRSLGIRHFTVSVVLQCCGCLSGISSLQEGPLHVLHSPRTWSVFSSLVWSWCADSFAHDTGGGGISSSSSSSLSLGGGVDGVYLSSNATPPAGYSSGGSLYRGSGFWVRTPPIGDADPAGLSVFAEVVGHSICGAWLSW